MKDSTRQLQVGELIKRFIASRLYELDFYGIDPLMINIMEVKMSSDLKHANVYITLQEGQEAAFVLSTLAKIKPNLLKGAGLRFSPKVRFIIDDSLEKSRKIDELLRQ